MWFFCDVGLQFCVDFTQIFATHAGEHGMLT